jgi:hypothetical protein
MNKRLRRIPQRLPPQNPPTTVIRPNTGAAPAAMVRLFDGHRLGEIARLVDVSSEDKRSVVCEKL